MRSSKMIWVLLPILGGLLMGFISHQGSADAQLPLTVQRELLQLDPATGRHLWQGIPYSGEALTHYLDGQPASSEIFLEGKREGNFRKWFPNRHLSFQANYVGGRLHGMNETWWSDGSHRSASQYVVGYLHGKSKQWYRSGALFKSLNHEHGQESGRQQAWRENGQLFCNYDFRNGRIYGLKRATMCFGVKDDQAIASR